MFEALVHSLMAITNPLLDLELFGGVGACWITYNPMITAIAIVGLNGFARQEPVLYRVAKNP